MTWSDQLLYDPVERLVGSEDPTVRTFSEHHLQGRCHDLRAAALGCREVRRSLSSQSEDGSWHASGKRRDDPHATMVTSLKTFRTLVHHYGLDRSEEMIGRAAEHLFTYQSAEGDVRGMIGGQYATYYTGEIVSLLIRAGYSDDERTERALAWLLSMRQDDGGWTIPILTLDLPWKEVVRLTSYMSEPLLPDRSRPSSHNWTDMVLRAFAAHPSYRYGAEAERAADLLKGSLFRPDAYRSYGEVRSWTRFVGWWPNLLTALEILAEMGYRTGDADVHKGMRWFVENQREDGLWDLEKDRPGKTSEREWLSLRICRMMMSFDIDRS